jgi:uncharacterized membrane protein YgcG
VAQVPGGDGFNAAQRAAIDKAIRDAETTCRFEFSVYVGRAEGEHRAYAARLHASLVKPDCSVLILLDPVGKALEVVTGSEVRRNLTDDEVALVVAQMRAELAEGRLVDALVRGINQLAAYARKPPALHV